MRTPARASHSPFGELLGRRVLNVDSDGRRVEVTYEAGPEFTNRNGSVAGGALAAMLDSLTGLVAVAGLADGVTAVHTSLRVEYLKRARCGELRGRAHVVEQVDRDIRCLGELHDAEGALVARAEATLRVVRTPGGSASG
jgi:uncharacterized protein (TIGR00369 family)